jgi:hypothetical protein
MNIFLVLNNNIISFIIFLCFENDLPIGEGDMP